MKSCGFIDENIPPVSLPGIVKIITETVTFINLNFLLLPLNSYKIIKNDNAE